MSHSEVGILLALVGSERPDLLGAMLAESWTCSGVWKILGDCHPLTLLIITGILLSGIIRQEDIYVDICKLVFNNTGAMSSDSFWPLNVKTKCPP